MKMLCLRSGHMSAWPLKTKITALLSFLSITGLVEEIAPTILSSPQLPADSEDLKERTGLLFWVRHDHLIFFEDSDDFDDKLDRSIAEAATLQSELEDIAFRAAQLCGRSPPHLRAISAANLRGGGTNNPTLDGRFCSWWPATPSRSASSQPDLLFRSAFRDLDWHRALYSTVHLFPEWMVAQPRRDFLARVLLSTGHGQSLPEIDPGAELVQSPTVPTSSQVQLVHPWLLEASRKWSLLLQHQVCFGTTIYTTVSPCHIAPTLIAMQLLPCVVH